MKKPHFLLNNFKLKRPIGPGLSVFRRFLFLGGLLISASGCTPGGIRLLSQLEATPLKKAIIKDWHFCKQNVGEDSKTRQDLCNGFFASLRISSHCLEMRETEPVEQEYCERFIYRMIIRPTRFFGQADDSQDEIRGKGGDAGPDWFDAKVWEVFIKQDSEPLTATDDERKLILMRIAKDLKLARGVRERDQRHSHRHYEGRGDGLAGSWSGTGSGLHMFRLAHLFKMAKVARDMDGGDIETAIGKLNEDLSSETGDQKFIQLALSQPIDPIKEEPVAGVSFNIHAVRWLDDHFFWSSHASQTGDTDLAKALRRKFYLKSWCSLDWDGDTDQTMLTLHKQTEAWHEDNKFFVMLLMTVLKNDRGTIAPLSAIPSWWEADFDDFAGDTDIKKVEGVFSDNEWRDGTENICDEDLPWEPF